MTAEEIETLLRQARAFGAEQAKRADAYTGGPKPFIHNGQQLEAAMPWMSDVEIASMVRMLMRTDFAHEAIVCAARDRILHLAQANQRLENQAANLRTQLAEAATIQAATAEKCAEIADGLSQQTSDSEYSQGGEDRARAIAEAIRDAFPSTGEG